MSQKKIIITLIIVLILAFVLIIGAGLSIGKTFIDGVNQRGDGWYTVFKDSSNSSIYNLKDQSYIGGQRLVSRYENTPPKLESEKNSFRYDRDIYLPEITRDLEILEGYQREINQIDCDNLDEESRQSECKEIKSQIDIAINKHKDLKQKIEDMDV